MDEITWIIVFAAIAGGSVAPFAKLALEVFHPFSLIFLRFSVASLSMLPFVLRRRELNLAILRELLWVAAIGSLNPILLFIALRFTPSSVSPLIYAGVPLMTAVFLHLFRHRQIKRAQVLGILVGFVGVALIIVLPFMQAGRVDMAGFWGNLLILGAAIAFMLYGVLSAEKQQQLNISPLSLTFYFALVTMLFSIPFAAYELWGPGSAAPQPVIGLKHVLSALEIGLAGTSLFYFSYQYAIQRSNELTASLFTYLQPVAAIGFSVLLLSEKITPPFLLGGALAVLGAHLASRARG